MSSYGGFVLLDEYMPIKDIENSDNSSEFLIVVQLYGAVPLGTDVSSGVDISVIPKERFCCLGETYRSFMMDVRTLISRCDRDERRNDYEQLRIVPGCQPFGLWSEEGKLVSIPSNILQNSRGYPEFDPWDVRQKENWIKILRELSDPRTQFNVYSRFIQPEKDDIDLLVFTPLDRGALFTVEELKRAFDDAFESKNLIKYNYKVWTFDDARNAKLIPVSTHYFGFYCTWMSRKTFQGMWKETPQFKRPWPSQSDAKKIDDELLKNKGSSRDGYMTFAKISRAKMAATVRKPRSQQAVTGCSATKIAELIWGRKNLKYDKPADAEWLHRTAFHFGGLGDKVNLASSQTKENLIFGTGECNTHMIRAENAITSVLTIQEDKNCLGTLRTMNRFKGKVFRLDYTGERKQDSLEDWVKDEKYMWLSLGLTYEWIMTSSSSPSLNGMFTFDPFSRYVPLRVEARLDDALMDFLQKRDNSVASSPTRGTSFQASQASATWNAMRIQQELITVSGIMLREPVALFDYPRDSGSRHTGPSALSAQSRLLPSARRPGFVLPSESIRHIADARERIKALRSMHKTAATNAPLLQAYSQHSSSRLHSASPANGFVVSGIIDLFGHRNLPVTLEVWQGPPPPDVTIHPGVPPSVQRAFLPGDFRFTSILPILKGTAFDQITFRDTSILHQNYPFDRTKAVGWHFIAHLVINDSCGELRDSLSTIFGVGEPALYVHAFLASSGNWDAPLRMHSFTLEGVFAEMRVNPIRGLTLTRIGARLFSIRGIEFDPYPRTTMKHGFAMFGGMDLDVPCTTKPLKLEFEVQVHEGVVKLSADVHKWDDPLGAKGLTLMNAAFSTTFPLSNPWNSIAFDVSAHFIYKSMNAEFTGTFVPGGSFALSATIYRFDVSNISDLFEWMTGDKIAVPEIDIQFGSATIAIGSGLDITLDKVSIGDDTTVDARLEICSHAVLIRGNLSSTVVEFAGIKVRRAYLQVRYETVASGKKTDVIIGGRIAFSGLELDAAVYLYRSKGDESDFQWTVLSALTAGSDQIALSKLVPEVKGTFLDFALTNAVFVAASCDNPDTGNMITSGYNFNRGVQICATFDRLDPLDKVMRSSVHGLVLRCGWSEKNGFELDIFLPAPACLSLKRGITTKPFRLAIQTKPLELILSAGLSVPVASSTKPLDFTLTLGLTALAAHGSGEMAGWWVNPLGLSPAVKIGPNVALSIGIIYAQFVSTGTISSFGIRGGIEIGKTSAEISMEIDEDPMRELLYAKIQKLNIAEVIAFAGKVMQCSLPQTPRDFLRFEEVKIYICPAGVTIGTVTYPQGFSFMARMIMFGKKAEVACALEVKQINIKGAVDGFKLGPLGVHGTRGPQATVACTIGLHRQHIAIDGVVKLFDSEVAVRIEVDALPDPKFSWYTYIRFNDLMTFRLTAGLEGVLNFGSLDNVDFVFDALMEQNIVQYIHDQLVEQFSHMHKSADEMLRAAEDKVTQLEKQYNDGINEAKARVDEADRAWKQKEREVRKTADAIIRKYDAAISSLQTEIQHAKAEYHAAMEKAQCDLAAANRARAQKLADAQHEIDNAERALIAGLRKAQHTLDEAEAVMNHEFGQVHQDIENARRDVHSLQHQIDDIYETLHEYERAPWYEFWKKAAIAGLYIGAAALEAAKIIADGVLQAAEAVLESSRFIAVKGGIDTARRALDVARFEGEATLGIARTALRDVDALTSAAIDIARGVVKGVERGAEWVAFDGATKALEVYKEANKGVYHEARNAIDGLANCVEFIAYQEALGGLELAQGIPLELEAAKKGLEILRDGVEEALEIGNWMAEFGSSFFNIQKIRLSGSLRGVIGNDGKQSNPLRAEMDFMLVGKQYKFEVKYHPKYQADFIEAIFKKLWDGIKGIILATPPIIQDGVDDDIPRRPSPSFDDRDPRVITFKVDTITAQTDTTISVRASNQNAERRLWLLTKPTRREILDSIRPCSVSITVSARHQGWVSRANQGSWSWFELAIIRNNAVISRGIGYRDIKTVRGSVLTWRIVAVDVRNGGTFRKYQGSLEGAQLRTFQEHLEAGDRLAVFACAQYPGWACYGQSMELKIAKK